MSAETGPKIAAKGAELRAEHTAVAAIDINEGVPGWKSRDIAKMNTISEIEAKQVEVLGQAQDALASEFHEEWRKTRLGEDGIYEPRIKSTKDTEWIEAHGTDQVDIANSTYEELPADWQAENKAAAEVVVGLMVDRDGKIDLTDPTTRSEVGGVIHDAWLSRNEWAKDGELGVPFDQLPEAEKSKDLDQITVAQRVFGTQQ